jgi:peptidyl-dipeptidase A
VVILHQLHAHICRELVQAPPQDCSYYQNRRVGDYLKNLLSVGATRDWRELIRETTGSELTARPLVEFYAPLTERLTRENSGQTCTR